MSDERRPEQTPGVEDQGHVEIVYVDQESGKQLGVHDGKTLVRIVTISGKDAEAKPRKHPAGDVVEVFTKTRDHVRIARLDETVADLKQYLGRTARN